MGRLKNNAPNTAAKAIDAAPNEVNKAPDPVPGNNGKALDRLLTYFQAEHPQEWENLRLTPLQHGLPEMAKLLK